MIDFLITSVCLHQKDYILLSLVEIYLTRESTSQCLSPPYLIVYIYQEAKRSWAGVTHNLASLLEAFHWDEIWLLPTDKYRSDKQRNS